MIARRAVECNDEQKRPALREAMERMKQAAAAHDDEAWIEADMELHDVIFSMCPNERAARIIRSLNEQWWRVRTGFLAVQGRIEPSNREHESVVESILGGDGEEADRLMRLLLNNVREELVDLLVNVYFALCKKVSERLRPKGE